MTIVSATQGCPCTDESTTLSSLSGRNFCKTPKNESGLQLIAGGACFPFSYGSSMCLQHDLVHDPACQVDRAGEELIPSYCFRPWCYVDPDVCKRDSMEQVYRSSYFPFDSGVDLFYSYSTCNSTADDWSSVHTDIIVGDGALGGVAILASVPTYQYPTMYKRDPVSGDPLTVVGSEYYNNSIGYEGIFPGYIKSIVAISKGDIKNVSYTYRSRSSSILHPTSSFTATVKDIEDGLIDMGVGRFWITGQRLKMVAFTIPILYDKTFLVVPLSTENLSDQILKVLAPFSYGVWIAVLLIIIASAFLSVWFSDPFDQARQQNRNPQHRRKTAYARLAVDAFLEKGMFFFSAGVEQEAGASLPNKILMFGFAFFILIAVSAYVANLAAFLTRSTATSINTIEAAVKEGLVICAHPAVETELNVAWPNAKFHFSQSGKELFGMIEDYESGKCQVLAVGFEETSVNIGIREKLCENGLVYTDSLIIETPVAFPINAKLAPGFSYWMYEAEKYHGVSIKKLNEERLDQIVASCTLKLSEQGGESSDYDEITIQNFSLPLVLYLACAGLAIILQLVHQYYPWKGMNRTLIGRNSQLNLSIDRPAFQRRRKTADRESDSSEEENLNLPQSFDDNDKLQERGQLDHLHCNDETDSTAKRAKSLYVGTMNDLSFTDSTAKGANSLYFGNMKDF